MSLLNLLGTFCGITFQLTRPRVLFEIISSLPRFRFLFGSFGIMESLLMIKQQCGIPIASKYSSCFEGSIENVNYIFSDSYLAKSNYSFFVFGHTLLNSKCWTIQCWSSFKSSNQFILLTLLLPLLFLSFLYFELWLALNKAKFENVDTTAITIISKIKKWMRDLNLLLKTKVPMSNINNDILISLHISKLVVQTKKHILVKWVSPPLSTLKLNIDGTSKGNLRLAGCVGRLCWCFTFQ